MNISRKKFVVICCIAVIFFFASILLFFHGGYLQKIISKIAPSKQISFQPKYDNKELDAWNNCLDQLHIDSDIVFFGDSITRRGNFSEYFPDKTICNLGLGSDTILGMIERVSMIESVSPDIVFIMGGINSLRNDTLEQSIEEYKSLIDQICEMKSSNIFILSVLPVSKEISESLPCSPETIISFNRSISAIAESKNLKYIDLYSLFVSSEGYIKPEFTTDGVHLTDNAYQLFEDTISPFIN